MYRFNSSKVFSGVSVFFFSDGAQEPGCKLAHAHRLEGLPLASSAEPVSAMVNFFKSTSMVLWEFRSLLEI